MSTILPKQDSLPRPVRLGLLLLLMYAFFLSISLMGDSFQFFGRGFAEQLLTTTADPFNRFIYWNTGNEPCPELIHDNIDGRGPGRRGSTDGRWGNTNW